jgi:cardiolipin synthase
VTSGNHVTLLPESGRTFDEMIQLIEGARRTVDLESYIFKADATGRRFRDALEAAAHRGVRVRVLLDWVGRLGTPMSFFAPLQSRTGLVRVFNRPGWRPWFGLLPRDHRKLLVVDGHAGVTGGIGIGDEWRYGLLRRHRQPWRDTCVRIEGPAASDLAAAFRKTWAIAGGEKRPRRALRKLVARATGGELDPATAEPSLVGIVEGEPGRLRVGRALHLQAAAAKRSIWIASAYFVPSFAEVEALAGAARDGVDVRLLVPSKYDHMWAHILTRRYYNRLLRNRVRIWEWSGEMMHAKTTVIDGRWTRVGSTDFNPLGIAINYELDAMIEDPVVGTAAEAMFLADLSRSREVHRRRRR